MTLTATPNGTVGTIGTSSIPVETSAGTLILSKNSSVVDVENLGNVIVNATNTTTGGTIYLFSSGNLGIAGTISANQLYVQANGLITDTIPAGTDSLNNTGQARY